MCVLVARAFSRVYNLKLSTRGEMELAYLGEIVTPSKCGRMDQVTPVPPLTAGVVTRAASDATEAVVTAQACAYGSQPVVMSYDGDQIEVDTIDVGAEMHLVIADLNAAKDTARSLVSCWMCHVGCQRAAVASTSPWLAPSLPRNASYPWLRCCPQR
jgi:galactokinase